MEETSLVTLPKQRQGLILVGGVRFCMLHYIAKKKKKTEDTKGYLGRYTKENSQDYKK